MELSYDKGNLRLDYSVFGLKISARRKLKCPAHAALIPGCSLV